MNASNPPYLHLAKISKKVFIMCIKISYKLKPHLTSGASAKLKMVCTAKLCTLGVVSPAFESKSGSICSTSRAISAEVTLSKFVN